MYSFIYLLKVQFVVEYIKILKPTLDFSFSLFTCKLVISKKTLLNKLSLLYWYKRGQLYYNIVEESYFLQFVQRYQSNFEISYMWVIDFSAIAEYRSELKIPLYNLMITWNYVYGLFKGFLYMRALLTLLYVCFQYFKFLKFYFKNW